jgi:hypothetical protein
MISRADAHSIGTHAMTIIATRQLVQNGRSKELSTIGSFLVGLRHYEKVIAASAHNERRERCQAGDELAWR